MQILGIYLYVTALGFVAAGVLASFVQLVWASRCGSGRAPNRFFRQWRGTTSRFGRPRRLDAERVAGSSNATEGMVRHLGHNRRCLEPLVWRAPGYADAAASELTGTHRPPRTANFSKLPRLP